MPEPHAPISGNRHAIWAVLATLLCACAPADLDLSGSTMGTVYTVKIVAPPSTLDPESLSSRIEAVLEQVNAQMSTYVEDSEISRFNREPSTEWFGVSAELQQVVTAALEVNRLSDGAFDVTVAPLVNLWGFGPGLPERPIPDQDAIDRARQAVGSHLIEVRSNPPALRKRHPALSIDLSALAKGFAVDQLVHLLEQEGLENFLVEIGGDMATRGHNASGGDWRVAVEEPNPFERRVHNVLPLSGQAIATSGDYRNFFDLEGRRYSHTIDPRTGRPVTHGLASVSVVDSSAMQADAMATALLVLGLDAGIELAEEQNIAAFFLCRDEERIVEVYTPEMEQFLTPESSTP